ncbi:hypothetical protein WKT22_01006 [Candidatus Lokiarchaeum ossiferum]
MSFNFAIKDLYFYKSQSKSYMKINIAIIALAIFFVNIIPSLGLLFLPERINTFTYTIVEIFTQYNLFLIILTLLLTIFIIITNNHALIQTRKKDIAVMKAVGTYPRQLYSFYLSELLLILMFTVLVGFIVGFVVFLGFFLIFNQNFPTALWLPDTFLGPSLIIGILFFSYFINGYEIRKIGRKSYNATKTGKISESIHAKLGPNLKKWLNNRSINLTMAIKNLMRKKYLVREYIVMIAIAGMVMFTGIIGVLVLSNSGSAYVESAQGRNIIIIGAEPVVDSIDQGYQKFTDNSIEPLIMGNYTDEEYNLTAYTSEFESTMQTYNLNKWESRLYSVQTVYEHQGFAIVNTETTNVSLQYKLIGDGNHSLTIPVQGVVFGSTVQNWYHNGALINFLSGAAVGDSLAGEQFESALNQDISVYNNETDMKSVHKINAIVIDPLNNGNSAYFNILDLQEDLGKANYTNLLFLDYSTIADDSEKVSELISDLEASVLAYFGDGFVVRNFSQQFRQNLDNIHSAETITLGISVIMGILILYILHHYQKARVEEDQKDLIIIKALGAKRTDIRNSAFLEQCGMIILGLLLALMGAMIILIFFLMEESELPSILVPLGMFFGILCVLLISSFITTHIAIKKNHKKLATLEL